MSANIVVLISGGGSNLQGIIDHVENGSIDGRITAVISNKADVLGLVRAQKAGIATEVLDHKAFTTREDFDIALAKLIDTYNPDLVVLAGFMRILTAQFVEHYHGKMLNIHPSLLPKYQGLHTHKRALEANDSEHGVTVHFVTAELDGGPNIIQAVVQISSNDDEATLAKRVLAQEHVIYPMAVQWFCQSRIAMTNEGVTLDGNLLPNQGFQIHSDRSI